MGKRSPVVRLGTQRAAALLPWICGSLYGLTAIGVLLHCFPLWTLLILGSVPVARKLCHFIGSQHDQPEKLTFCRLIAVELHFWSGLLFGLGFWLP